VFLCITSKANCKWQQNLQSQQQCRLEGNNGVGVTVTLVKSLTKASVPQSKEGIHIHIVLVRQFDKHD
jgi:hypothetical protein